MLFGSVNGNDPARSRTHQIGILNDTGAPRQEIVHLGDIVGTEGPRLLAHLGEGQKGPQKASERVAIRINMSDDQEVVFATEYLGNFVDHDVPSGSSSCLRSLSMRAKLSNDSS